MSEFNANYPQQQQQYGYPPQQYGGKNSQQQQFAGNYPQQQPPPYTGSYPQQQSQQQCGNYPEQHHQGFDNPSYDQGNSKSGLTYAAGDSGRRPGAEAEGQKERFSGFSDKVWHLYMYMDTAYLTLGKSHLPF